MNEKNTIRWAKRLVDAWVEDQYDSGQEISEYLLREWAEDELIPAMEDAYEEEGDY